jgi:hypothetical protein
MDTDHPQQPRNPPALKNPTLKPNTLPPRRAPGCREPQCALCQHSTDRRCTFNFDRKYLVNDRMLARCGAVIRLEMIDCATGAPFEGELPEVFLEMMVLDGNLYDTKYLGEADRWVEFGGVGVLAL